ncbi:MAG: polymer-forming cytoskeletal protein [Alphaproteobacteria bacterium]
MFSRKKDDKKEPATEAEPAVSRPAISRPTGIERQRMANNPADRTPEAGAFRPEVARRVPTIPGSGPTSTPLGATAQAAPKAEPERKLTVGQGIVLNGEISACEHLLVEGRVEASLKNARIIEVAESGTFKGDADIEDAIVGGCFEGDLVVHGKITIRGTGRVVGSLRYAKMEVESGGVISGTMEELEKTAPAAQPVAAAE